MTQTSYFTHKLNCIISTQIIPLIETLIHRNTEEKRLNACRIREEASVITCYWFSCFFPFFSSIVSLLLCLFFFPFSLPVKFFIEFFFRIGLKLALLWVCLIICVLECQVLDIVPSMQIEYYPRPHFLLFWGFLSETEASQNNCRLFGSVVTHTHTHIKTSYLNNLL